MSAPFEVRRFKIALCNEVLGSMELAAQFEYAARLGYDALELAPFTLGEEPHRLPASARRSIRAAASQAGLEIAGFHWLLVTPQGLSINTPDSQTRRRTRDVLRGLIEFCAEVGGKVMVHGSPAQRYVAADDTHEAASRRAVDLFQEIAELARQAGITYCIEPLAPGETNFINTLDEAAKLVEAIANPAFKTMIDTRAARLAEADPVEEIIDRWFPTGIIRHIHLNDRNRRAPGQGEDLFAQVLERLLHHQYSGYVSVEPFDYHPDGLAAAAYARGYLQGILAER